MSDPFYLADILLGRVGVLRSTAESIVLELCEAKEKLDSQTIRSDAAESTDTNAGSTLSPEDALRFAIQNKLKRVQTNLELLRRLGPEFGT